MLCPVITFHVLDAVGRRWQLRPPGLLMLMHQHRGDKQLDADEEKEEGSDIITNILGNREPSRCEQKGKDREDTQADPHGGRYVVESAIIKIS